MTFLQTVNLNLKHLLYDASLAKPLRKFDVAPVDEPGVVSNCNGLVVLVLHQVEFELPNASWFVEHEADVFSRWFSGQIIVHSGITNHKLSNTDPFISRKTYLNLRYYN